LAPRTRGRRDVTEPNETKTNKYMSSRVPSPSEKGDCRSTWGLGLPIDVLPTLNFRAAKIVESKLKKECSKMFACMHNVRRTPSLGIMNEEETHIDMVLRDLVKKKWLCPSFEILQPGLQRRMETLPVSAITTSKDSKPNSSERT
jgi:hypothetical protein